MLSTLAATVASSTPAHGGSGTGLDYLSVPLQRRADRADVDRVDRRRRASEFDLNAIERFGDGGGKRHHLDAELGLDVNQPVVEQAGEMSGVCKTLDAAAWTYVAAFIASLGNLLYLLSIVSRNR